MPIFAEALNDKSIGVCKWNESGTTIDTALPDLRDLTDDKESWRAVIVRYYDDDYMASFERTPENPYDFTINKDNEEVISENKVPLVRLTHMLGGVPPLEVRYFPELFQEKHKAPRIVYHPENQESPEAIKKKNEHNSLVKKYQFDGKRPDSILLISFRKRISFEDQIDRASGSYKESQSSEFWKRNGYPSICRFLVFDYDKQGPVQKDADDLNFWISVLLLATNKLDSATLQAYRLYSVNTKMDKEVMESTFQEMVNKLRDAKRTLEADIRRDILNHVCEEDQLPDYRMEIPVVLKLPKAEDRGIKKGSFHLLSNGANSDLAIWNQQKNELEKDFSESVKSAERTLDQTADKMRESCFYQGDNVEILNRYQEEDLIYETNSLYHRIVTIQGELPKGDFARNEGIVASMRELKEMLISRIKKKPAIYIVLIATLLLILTSIPALILSKKSVILILLNLSYVWLIGVGVIIVSAIIALLIQKKKLNDSIDQYNQHIKNEFNKLVNTADDYSAYLSAIASHVRGSSYLVLSDEKKYYNEEKHSSKYKHIKTINSLLSKLKQWSKAYHLNVDFTSPRTELRVEVDTLLSPVKCKLYYLTTDKKNTIWVNNSGMMLDSPVVFVDRISIVREELYEGKKDDGRS